MRKKPPDSLRSLDNALRVLHLLRDQGVVTVSEVALMLGISASSAHRLLATLSYRDFATQNERRQYLRGPALSLMPSGDRPLVALRAAMLPSMRRLAFELGETVTLSVLIDIRVRFISAAESTRALRVGDQEGTVLPAHLTSGGKVMLAALSDRELSVLYGMDGRPERIDRPEWKRLQTELRKVRQTGFAVNHGDAEPGVSAIGLPVTNSSGAVIAGLSVAIPSVRFEAVDVENYVLGLRRSILDSRAEIDAVGELG
jgi:DNA-binding IclR family transcriptional regulator